MNLADRIYTNIIYVYLAIMIGLGIAIYFFKSHLDNERTNRVVVQKPITEKFKTEVVVEVRPDGEEQVAFYALWDWNIVDNKIEICGAVSFNPDKTRKAELMLTGAKVKVKGKKLFKRLTFFNEVPFVSPLLGYPSNCTQVDYDKDPLEFEPNDFEISWLKLKF